MHERLQGLRAEREEEERDRPARLLEQTEEEEEREISAASLKTHIKNGLIH